MKQVIKLFRQSTSERMSGFCFRSSLLLQRTFHLTFEVALQNAIMSLSILLSPFYRQRSSCTKRGRNFNHLADQQLKENCKEKDYKFRALAFTTEIKSALPGERLHIVFWKAQSSPTPFIQLETFALSFL